MILTEVKISHMKTGRKFSVILSVFPINPNTTFEGKQRALDGSAFAIFGFSGTKFELGTSSAVRNLYEKYDISKYEIPETKNEALRISSKLVLQFFLGGEKNLVFRNLVFFVFFFVMEDDP